jgi:hypothetical protein
VTQCIRADTRQPRELKRAEHYAIFESD